MRARCTTDAGGRVAGFTLVELLIVVAILAVIASIALPNYRSALATARTGKARQELRTMATAIDLHRTANAGVLPLTLADVGHGGRRDPWGTPYCYLNFHAGTGDGLEWAVAHELVDPARLDDSGATLISADLQASYDAASLGMPTADTEPTDPVDAETVKRRDRFLFPLNSDYDLFSIGPNRDSRPNIGDALALDDVIRANDGGYFGRASDY